MTVIASPQAFRVRLPAFSGPMDLLLHLIREKEMETAPLKKADVIRISDNGEGIAEEIMKNIFDPFFTTKEEGTGLGLSIAYNIIHEHGGTLEASSQKGKGTDFTITLPIREKESTG